jgi:hypothetical protein
LSDLSPELAAAPLRQAQALESIAESLRELADSQLRIAAALERIGLPGSVTIELPREVREGARKQLKGGV